MTNVEYLSLQHNSFTGSIPTEIGILTALETFRLSFNSLTGPSLRKLDI